MTRTLVSPTLALVTDSARLRGRDLADVVHAAVDGGVGIVQLREKSLPHEALVELGQRVKHAIRGRALFFVNSDVEAAIALGADGVHLPEDGAPIANVRARGGPRMLISRAVHSIEAAIQAEHDGAGLVQLGAIFETASHAGRAPIGLALLRNACTAVSIPVIAIGGITPANAGEVMRAGASGVAVIGAIFDAPDPRAAVAALRAAMAAPIVART